MVDGAPALDFFLPVLIHGLPDQFRGRPIILLCKALKINVYRLGYIDGDGFHMDIMYVLVE
jgi:hypothetical protein